MADDSSPFQMLQDLLWNIAKFFLAIVARIFRGWIKKRAAAIGISSEKCWDRQYIMLLCSLLPTPNITEEIKPFVRIRKEKKRAAEKRDHIFITGGTGFLGGHIAHQVLKTTDKKLYLPVRPRKGMTLAERFEKMMVQHGMSVTKDELARCTFLEGDAKAVGFGISEETWAKVAVDTEEIIHCAMSITYAAPFEMLQHWLALAQFFAQISYEYDITLKVVGSILGDEAAEPKRDMWNSGYAQINKGKRELITAFQQQGVKTALYELGWILAPMGQPKFFQHDNVIFAMVYSCDTIKKAVSSNVPVTPVDVIGRMLLAPLEKGPIVNCHALICDGPMWCKHMIATMTPDMPTHRRALEAIGWREEFTSNVFSREALLTRTPIYDGPVPIPSENEVMALIKDMLDLCGHVVEETYKKKLEAKSA